MFYLNIPSGRKHFLQESNLVVQPNTPTDLESLQCLNTVEGQIFTSCNHLITCKTKKNYKLVHG